MTYPLADALGCCLLPFDCGATFAMLTALVPLSIAADCTGLRTFSEARRVLWATEELDPTKEASWMHTRPGFANIDADEHENGTIVPPDRVTWGMVVYGVSEVDTQKQTVSHAKEKRLPSRADRCARVLTLAAPKS